MGKKLSKETKEYLDNNPEGKIEDLPKEMKDIISNIFSRAEEVIKEEMDKDNSKENDK
jgi:hypothetical protein